MEHLSFHFDGVPSVPPAAKSVIVGVVASGNLEVLVEPMPAEGACNVEIDTASQGFGPIWEAVLRDFFERHPVGDVRISINDAGATPATVSLRLHQAIESFTERR